MSGLKSILLTGCFIAAAWFGPMLAVSAAAEGAGSLPKVYCADPRALASAKARLAAGDASLRPALDRLRADADNALKLTPPSVMDKKRVPPSGDKHDYVSQAPYFWADSNAPGHYIRRDGERNPEAAADTDAGRLGRVCTDAHTLALAYYFTGDEKYAAKAGEILRVWFLNPATRMNPNLNFGQGIPGEVEGRAAGLIGARGLVGLMDALGLLSTSKSWTMADKQAMTAWVEQYYHWLTTSKIGLGESAATNNHGTWYDTQVAALALYLGKTDAAREHLLKDRENRIGKQIEPDGREPRELQRTLSFNYSLFNLRALIDLASIGKNAGVDLWHYQTADGRSILKVLEFMAPYADPAKEWPYQQIRRPDRSGLGEVLLRASVVYPEANLTGYLKFFRAEELAAGPARLQFATAPIGKAQP